MKKVLSFLSLTIALVLLMTVTVSAFAANVLDNPNYQVDINGIRYTEKTVTENSKKQNLFYSG